ncbi:MAG: TraB/GumN family protein [Hominimerdicola sp.]
MKKKKLTSIISVVAMCAVILTSCGKSAESSSATENSSSKAETTTTTAPAESSLAETTASSADESSTAEGESDITPAMWVVTAPNGNKMTMLGSMHALKDECYPLPDEIMDAYNSADILAVECDTTTVSNETQEKLLKQMTYSDNTTLKDHISTEAYEALSTYVEDFGFNISVFDAYQPWAVSNTIDTLLYSYADLDTTIGIDCYLMGLAHEENKEIYEVESVDFQMDMLLGFSDDIYDLMFLEYEGETLKSQTETLNQMYDAWTIGNTDFIEEESYSTEDEVAEYTEEQLAAYEDYTNQMLTDRNVGMAEAVKKLLNDGKNVFYVVGEAHFVGDTGIIALLEQDGYTVERVEYN